MARLDLSGKYLGPDGIRKLVDDPSSADVETLLLGGKWLQDVDPVEREHADPKWKALVTPQLGDEGLLALGSVGQLRSLRSIDLSNVVASDDAWRAFARSPLVAQLQAFVADMVDMQADVIDGLLAHGTNLRSFAVHAAKGDEAARAIAQNGTNLWWLALRYLHNEGTQAILDAPLSINTLELHVAADLATVDIIKQRRGVPKLQQLHLPTTNITSGEIEVWTDWTGAEIGSSPQYWTVNELVAKHFKGDPLKLRTLTTWPHAWVF